MKKYAFIIEIIHLKQHFNKTLSTLTLQLYHISCVLIYILYAFPPVIGAIKQNAEAVLHPLYLADYREGVNSTKHILVKLLLKLGYKCSPRLRVTSLPAGVAQPLC